MSLIHRWPLTSDPNDVSGTLNLSTWNIMTYGTDGVLFDGMSDFMSCTYAPDTPTVMSMSLWIKPSSWGDDKGIALGCNTPWDNTWGISAGDSMYSSTRVSAHIGVGSYDPVYADSEWNSTNYPNSSHTMLCMTYDGTTLSLFRNGTTLDSGARSSFSFDSSFTVGAIGFGSYYAGYMSDLRIYDHSLSGTEINDLVSLGPNGFLTVETGSGIVRDFRESTITECDLQRDSIRDSISSTFINQSDYRESNENKYTIQFDSREITGTEIKNTNDERNEINNSSSSINDILENKGFAINVDGTYQGFIDVDGTSISNIIISDGTHKIEARPSGGFWKYGDPGCRYSKFLDIVIDGGTVSNTLYSVENLSSERTRFGTEITWSWPDNFSSVSANDFGLWFGESPIDTSGTPDYTVNVYSGKIYYRYIYDQSGTISVAVAARYGTNVGEVSELAISWNGAYPNSPENQFAETNP